MQASENSHDDFLFIDDSDQDEILPFDSIARFADHVLLEMEKNRSHSLAQMDSAINHSKYTAEQMAEIQYKIKTGQLKIRDSIVYNKIYKDTIVKRVLLKKIIKLDTIRDTITIIDTIKKQVELGKKRRKKWKR